MDVIDQARSAEMKHRKLSLKKQLENSKETETPDEIDGVRYCLDCEVAICKERLEARPESVRCVECKSIKEQKDKQYA